MDTSDINYFNRCVGKKNYALAHKTFWYGDYKKSVNDFTLCHYCYNRMKDLRFHQNLYQLKTHSNTIDCDGDSLSMLSQMDFNNFTFKVMSGDDDQTTTYNVHPPKSGDRKQGVYIVELPKNTNYFIRIIQNRLSYGDNYESTSDRFNDGEVYFTYDMSVGDKKVESNLINNTGKPIHYRGSVDVKGFTDSDQFLFDNDGNSQVITVTINLFKRLKLNNRIDYNINNNDDDDSSDDDEMFNNFLANNIPELAEMKSSNQLNRQTSNQTNNQLNNQQTYGTPVKPTNNTRPTVDTFVPINGFTVLIQLIYVNRGNENISLFDQQMKKIEQLQSSMLEHQRKLLLSNSVDLSNTNNEPTIFVEEPSSYT